MDDELAKDLAAMSVADTAMPANPPSTDCSQTGGIAIFPAASIHAGPSTSLNGEMWKSAEAVMSTAAAVAAAAANATAEALPKHRLAGLEGAMQAMRELVCWPSRYSNEGRELGVRWPRGLLLHGPPGCGKTLLVQAVAEECDAALHVVTASSVVGAYVGESERHLREAFEAAQHDADAGRIAVVFLDEVDALCPRRDGRRQHEARVVAQLLTLLDGASTASSTPIEPPLQLPVPLPAAAAPGGSSAPASSCIATDNPLAQGGLDPAVAPDLASAVTGGAVHGKWAAPRRLGHVAVVAATNRPNALDPALRRPGRLDREVLVAVPGPQQRASILRLHTQALPLAADVDLMAVASSCHGYSGADLAALVREAAMQALSAAVAADSQSVTALGGHGDAASVPVDPSDMSDRMTAQILRVPNCRLHWSLACTSWRGGVTEGSRPGGDLPAVTSADFVAARRRVGPSIVRGTEVEVAPVAWDDIGGLEGVKKRLRQAVEWPLHHAAAFDRLGLTAPRGVLLHGPPGCSKTTLAGAIATNSGATLLPLSCAQLYSMYVGDGEALLRDTFMRARMAAPAIIFLDEVDAIAARRGEVGSNEGSGGAEAGVRLLSTLLTEMDGMELTTGVMVLAATNRPGTIDAALMRPGRFDVRVYVPPPDSPGRLQVLRIHTRRMPLANDVDLRALADSTERFTGAELAGICREAAVAALREDLASANQVAARHFAAARSAATASLTPQALCYFERWGQPAKPAIDSTHSLIPAFTGSGLAFEGPGPAFVV